MAAEIYFFSVENLFYSGHAVAVMFRRISVRPSSVTLALYRSSSAISMSYLSSAMMNRTER